MPSHHTPGRPVVISNRLVVVSDGLVMAVVVSDRLVMIVVVISDRPVVVRDRDRPVEIGMNKQNLVKVRKCIK